MESHYRLLVICAVASVMATTAFGVVQIGRQFPTGLQLQSVSACSFPEDEGVLRYQNGSVDVCREGVWTVVGDVEVSELNAEIADLRAVIASEQHLQQNVGTILAIQSCNMHGVYNVSTYRCRCHCPHWTGSADLGCHKGLFCEHCEDGYSGEYCQVDARAPQLTLLGGATVTIEAGTEYVDSGATAFDLTDGDITSSVVIDTGSVVADVAGTYTVTITVADASSNSATVTRTVVVEDTTPPSVALNGDAVIVYEANSDEARDAVDPSINATDNAATSMAIASNFTDAKYLFHVVGAHVVQYIATDVSGNNNTIERTFQIVDTTPPVIVVIGWDSLSVGIGFEYVEYGVAVSDNSVAASVANPIPDDVSVVTESNVNTSTAGAYNVTYTATDGSGNSATAIREVFVSNDYGIMATGVRYVHEEKGGFDNSNYAKPSFEMLNDGRTDTGGYGSQNSNSPWLQADFGVPVHVETVVMGGGPIANWGNAQSYIDGSQVEFSTDNANWTTAVTLTVANYGGSLNYPVTINPPQTARYWRLSRSTWLATTEFRFIGGTDVCSSGGHSCATNEQCFFGVRPGHLCECLPPFHSPSPGVCIREYTPSTVSYGVSDSGGVTTDRDPPPTWGPNTAAGVLAALVDGSATTDGFGSRTSADPWLMAAFERPVWVEGVTLGTGNINTWGSANSYLLGAELQYAHSANGPWTTVNTVQSGQLTSNTLFNLSAGGVNAQYWRLFRDNWLATTEFKFY